MQADEEDGDYITRAKAKLAHWSAMRDDTEQACRFDKCTATELVSIAETGKDQNGRKLTSGALYALHGAWEAMFGEGIGTRAGAASVPDRVAEPLDEHPLLAVPDDQMLRPRDVVRICGIPRTTLKRWRRNGRFPKPQRLNPHAIHVGWPARQVKAWLRSAA